MSCIIWWNWLNNVKTGTCRTIIFHWPLHDEVESNDDLFCAFTVITYGRTHATAPQATGRKKNTPPSHCIERFQNWSVQNMIQKQEKQNLLCHPKSTADAAHWIVKHVATSTATNAHCLKTYSNKVKEEHGSLCVNSVHQNLRWLLTVCIPLQDMQIISPMPQHSLHTCP